MDSSTPSSRAALYQDSLTGLLTVQGWVKELLGSVFPTDGGMIACEIVGVNSVNQTFGHAAGDALISEVVLRVRQALPPTTILMRGRGNTLFAFLPGVSGMIIDAFVSHLRQSVCGTPLPLPGGEQIFPKIVTAVLSVEGNTPVLEAAQTLERSLVRQPEYASEPTGVQRAVSAIDELTHRLEAVRLFGRDELIERILAELKLPVLQPETVILVAPPQAGKTRLLGNIISMMDGQHLPRAEVVCRASDQQVPFTLMVSIITQFLTAYPTALLQQRLGTLCTSTSPWLVGLFPVLRGYGEPPPPPREEEELRHGLEAVLMELVRYIPHVAVIHSIHVADAQSLSALAALQSIPGHGLRVIGGVDSDDEELPTVLRRLIRQRAKVITLPALSEVEVMEYLREIVPTVAQSYVAARLHRETGGLLLSIEATLRAWVEDGMLSLNEGRWEFFPEKVVAQADRGAVTPLTDYATAAEIEPLTPLQSYADDIPVPSAAPDIVPMPIPVMAQPIIQPVLLGAMPTPGTSQQRAEQEQWDVPTSSPVTAEDMPRLVDAIQFLRLAGNKLKLYPPNSPIVQRAVRDAVVALDRLLAGRPCLVISYDGTNVAFDGQILARRDLQITIKDFQTWMSDGLLRAIGLLPGISDPELLGFMKALVLFDLNDNRRLVDLLQELPMQQVKVLSRESQVDTNLGGYSGGAGMPAGYGGAGVMTPEIASMLANMPAMTASPASSPPPAPAASSSSTSEAKLEPDIDPAVLLANPQTVDPAMWGRLPGMVDQASAPTRRLLMSHLTRWLRDQDAQQDNTRNCPLGLDQLLIQRLNSETDLIALRETALTTERRMEQLMQMGMWEEMIALLAPLRSRSAHDENADIQRQLGSVLDRIGEGTTLRGLIDQTVQNPGSLDRARRVIVMLGERALRPLINALKESTVMQERVRLMQLLREFGDTQQPLILDELRASNPWYVHRNLLQVLEEIGTPAALETIADKLRHEDSRVRAGALTAAVRIGREQASSYLLISLQDEDPDVRARALSLVGFCPTERVLEQVLRLLQPQRLGRDEAESVQLAAVLALGHFAAEDAYLALIEILQPRLFSPFRRKSDEVRSAAVSALVNHLDKPGAAEAIQQATRDRSMTVRQTAQRISAQYMR